MKYSFALTIITLSFTLFTISTSAQKENLGIFDGHTDVGRSPDSKNRNTSATVTGTENSRHHPVKSQVQYFKFFNSNDQKSDHFRS